MTFELEYIIARLKAIEDENLDVSHFIADLRTILSLARDYEKYENMILGIMEFLTGQPITKQGKEKEVVSGLPGGRARKCILCGKTKHLDEMIKGKGVMKKKTLYHAYTCKDCTQLPTLHTWVKR